eukprot:NODE_7683_length_750_cov_44.133971_g7433_i0.p1 GENE.NODE_7683_length_750_cov_44.133971_g7433_i0~~NODE_7683_length_750_cov_44.133971_g7433_i0.p1  ORF type:complete len:144 (-),score=7.08 NODE_7683_length_750_cov_44.133971_g7433_i0:149-580(-)
MIAKRPPPVGKGIVILASCFTWELFTAMDKVEAILSSKRYLCGNRLTLADVRLFTTLLRFDPVYVGHFKTNKKRVADYPNMYGFVREIYQMPGIAETCDIDHIKHHYYRSHPGVNANGLVPKGPDLDFTTPHGRGDKRPFSAM